MDPLTIDFPPYTAKEMLSIIQLDIPDSEKDDPEFFETFVKLIYDAFHRPCQNLNEMRHLVALLYPKYIEPVRSGRGNLSLFIK